MFQRSIVTDHMKWHPLLYHSPSHQPRQAIAPAQYSNLKCVSQLRATLYSAEPGRHHLFSNVSFQITTSNSVCFCHRLYMQVSFYARLRSWKISRQSKLHKSNTKFPFKKVYYLGVKGLTTSPYTVHNYTTSGHMVYLLYIHTTSGHKVYLLYIQYIYISIHCTYISVQYMYFLQMQ